MAAKQKVEFLITARDMTRGVFRRIRRSLLSMRTLIGGAFAALGLGSLVRHTLNFAKSMTNASDRLNATTRQMQALRVMAEDTGVSFETMVSVLQRLGRNADAAVDGNSELLMAFTRLGITFGQLREGRNNPVGLFMALADSVADAGDNVGALRNELARVGDTEIGQLIPLLQRGAGGIAREAANLQREGRIQSDAVIRQTAEQEAQLRRELLALQIEFAREMRQLLPLLIDAAKVLNQAADTFRQEGWPSAVRGVTNTVPTLRELGNAVEASSVGVSIFEGQLALQRLLERIANNTERTSRQSLNTLQ